MLNPALASLAPLIGDWQMQLRGAWFQPDPATRVIGSVTLAGIEGGAAVAMRQSGGEAPPRAVWIVGRDECEGEYHVICAGARGVSRI